MSQQAPAPARPPNWRERTQNFLLYGFAISVALHLIVGPFIKFERAPDAAEKVETVKIDKMPTPPPTPKPTPTPPPTPTPKPTVPPTPPPKNTPEPPKPKQIKINTIKTDAKPVGGPVEQANTHTQGSVNGVPNGTPTGVATQVPISTAPPATPAPPPPPTPAPTPTPLACANPNVPAKTVNAVQAETPTLAQQQGISGEVTVLVSLDENSKLSTPPTVQKSPSVLLNKAAIDAARQSTYQTEIRNCKPIAATYRFIVEFQSQ